MLPIGSYKGVRTPFQDGGECSPLLPPKARKTPPRVPPTVGGSIPIFRMSSKSLLKHKVFGPKSSKFSPAACSPPLWGGVLGGSCSPPSHLRWGGVLPKLPPLPPTVGGSVHPYTMARYQKNCGVCAVPQKIYKKRFSKIPYFEKFLKNPLYRGTILTSPERFRRPHVLCM